LAKAYVVETIPPHTQRVSRVSVVNFIKHRDTVPDLLKLLRQTRDTLCVCGGNRRSGRLLSQALQADVKRHLVDPVK
jgi:hypothetical protein